MGFKKSDIEYRALGYGYTVVPAVNVKVYGSVRDVKLPYCLGMVKGPEDTEFRKVMTDDEFTHDWIEEHLTDNDHWAYFNIACEQGWEYLNEIAKEIFGPNAKVYSEGRSGGWAYVDGITKEDVQYWDAIELNKWAKFSKLAKQVVENIPQMMVDLIYINAYDTWVEEQKQEKIAAGLESLV